MTYIFGIYPRKNTDKRQDPLSCCKIQLLESSSEVYKPTYFCVKVIQSTVDKSLFETISN